MADLDEQEETEGTLQGLRIENQNLRRENAELKRRLEAVERMLVDARDAAEKAVKR